MGTLSKTACETYTDLAAARLQELLTAVDALYSASSAVGFWPTVDALGDADLENALGASALTGDRFGLPASRSTILDSLCGLAGLRGVAAGLSTAVKAAAGGSYASMDAYLTAVGAQVHPLAAALLSGAGNTLTAANVFPPVYGSQAPTRVYTGADGALTDDTTDAVDPGTADVGLFTTNGHSVYVGFRSPFSALVAGLSTLASVTITPTIKYFSGNNGWQAVAGLTDGSAGFTKNDRIKWTVPSGWTPCHQDAGGNNFADLTDLYYLRISRGAAVLGTPPVGTSLRVIPAKVLNSASRHLGVPQPPLLLVRVTGVNTLAVEYPNGETTWGIDTDRFAPGTLKLRALTPLTTLTPTVSYVNQADANKTQAQSAWTSPAALDEVAVALFSGDTGAKSARTTGWAATTAGTEGVFEVIVPELRTPAR